MKKQKSYIFIFVVLLIVVLPVFLFSCKQDNSATFVNPTMPTNGAQTETHQDDMFSVVFYGPDNRTLFITEVASGDSAIPPVNPTMPQGYIFSHWDKDFSSVTEDMSIHAICKEISGQENVLALSGGSVQSGGEVVIPLQLCGNVNLCAFDIRIDYNGEILKFVEFRNKDGAVDANCTEDTGEIYLNFASMENTQGDVYLVELVFNAIGEQGNTSVAVNVVELIAYDADYNFYEPPYATISGNITIYEG